MNKLLAIAQVYNFTYKLKLFKPIDYICYSLAQDHGPSRVPGRVCMPDVPNKAKIAPKHPF